MNVRHELKITEMKETNCHLLAAQQNIQTKQNKTNEKCSRVFWKKSQENGPLAEKAQDKEQEDKAEKRERRYERGIKGQEIPDRG